MKATTPQPLSPGDYITDAERTAMLRELVRIAEAHAAGAIPIERAKHESQHAIAPLKRRVRMLTRQARLVTAHHHTAGAWHRWQ